jgi:Sigma-70, region 4
LNEREPLLARAPQQGRRLELRDLERALAKLPMEQRSLILLVALEGMSYEEVAAVLDVPIGTIRSRLSRGREALRWLMGTRSGGWPDGRANVRRCRGTPGSRKNGWALGSITLEPLLRGLEQLVC